MISDWLKQICTDLWLIVQVYGPVLYYDYTLYILLMIAR